MFLPHMLSSSMVRHGGKRGGNTYDNIHQSDLLQVLNQGRTKRSNVARNGGVYLPYWFNKVRQCTIRVVTAIDGRHRGVMLQELDPRITATR